MQSNDPTASLINVERRMRALVMHHTGEAGQAAAQHLSAGGSRIRARLALHACAALGVPDGPAEAVAAACELLHNASLVHDDLQDRDPHRRGQETVWRRHGDATAICVGDLLLSAAYGALAVTGADVGVLMARMHRRVGAVISGQCEDLALQGHAIDSLERYERVARGKSGPLLILPLELALALADRADAVGIAAEAGALFAIGYQAADDLEDVKRDTLNEELNVVAVLAARGHANPLEAARDLAIARFERCAAVATALPSGSGALLAAQAVKRAALLAGATASA
jgi:geranylgeranyl pyrophosphate synthase